MSQVLLYTTLCVTILSIVGAFTPSVKPNWQIQSIHKSGSVVSRDYGRLEPLVLLQSSPGDDDYYLYYEDENGEIRYVDSKTKQQVYSASDNGSGIPQQQQQSQFSDAEFEQPLDPLVKALTQMDEETANAPTTKVPLLGEIPLDGSIVVLLPAAIIAVAGFIFSIVIGIQSKDIIADQVAQVTESLSTPPVKEQVVSNDCRGLCSDQDKQLETMKNFMQKFAVEKEEETVVAVPVAKVEEASPVSEQPQGESSTISTEKTESSE